MHTLAQTIFYGILVNRSDSSLIPYAAVTAEQTGKSVVTDAGGKFQFALPANEKKITITITAIGVKASATFTAPFNKTDTVYADVLANALNDFRIKGLSAEEVVKKAVASIPGNYADSDYFNYSFYRRYQKLNDRYVNLFEACPVVMFRLSHNKYGLAASEAFAVTQLRRSRFHPDIMNVQEDNPADLIIQNPVYHLDAGSLLPSRFPNYVFWFDTMNRSDEDYMIRYTCNNFSTDNHGFAYYNDVDLKGEEYETGMLVIDRKTFAIKKISRKSIRHKDYQYPSVPTITPPNLVPYNYHTYFFEFVDGDLEAEYKERNGKWYLDKLFRRYTNDFCPQGSVIKDYSITDNFEWYAGPVSKYTTPMYVDKFYPKMATAIHNYDTAFWAADSFPFHYADRDEVYKNLQRDGRVEQQFFDETLVDEYVKKPEKK
jgi:hypothetical protein